MDSGELEKIIERAIQTELRYLEQAKVERLYDQPWTGEKPKKADKDKGGKYSKKYYKKYKKKHVLKEIFDLFD